VVFVPGHVWIPELAAGGLLAPLDLLRERIEPGLWDAYRVDDILPTVWQESHFEGHQYMLPFFSDGHILFYRSDLVDLEGDGGVPVVAPGLLPELAARVHNPPEVYGLALKAHPSEIFLDWLPYLWDAGGALLDTDGQAVIDSETAVHALDLYCRLRAWCPEDTHTYGNAEIADVLREGRAVFVTTWGGQAAPILLDPENAWRKRYRAAVFTYPWNATWGMGIPARLGEDTQVGALAALLSLAGPQQDLEIIQAAGSPVRESSYSTADASHYTWLTAQHKMLERARTLPAAPETGRYLGALYEAVYSAFTGDVTPGDALAKAAGVMRDTLSGR
jgi:multiple sugar transport system substrate-binding protein